LFDTQNLSALGASYKTFVQRYAARDVGLTSLHFADRELPSRFLTKYRAGPECGDTAHRRRQIQGLASRTRGEDSRYHGAILLPRVRCARNRFSIQGRAAAIAKRNSPLVTGRVRDFQRGPNPIRTPAAVVCSDDPRQQISAIVSEGRGTPREYPRSSGHGHHDSGIPYSSE